MKLFVSAARSEHSMIEAPVLETSKVFGAHATFLQSLLQNFSRKFLLFFGDFGRD